MKDELSRHAEHAIGLREIARRLGVTRRPALPRAIDAPARSPERHPPSHRRLPAPLDPGPWTAPDLRRESRDGKSGR